MRWLFRLRSWINPEVRDMLDGVSLFLAMTLLFCLIQSAHDDIVRRNPQFDPQRWWYPIYRLISAHPS
jgi:hypothetical protein